MQDKTAPSDLTGQLLIAMPGMSDPRFAGAVVFLCAHSPEGAMGLIVNRPIPELSFPEMLEQLGVKSKGPPAMPVCFGGPVETSRGFVLHGAGYCPPGRRNTQEASDGFMRIDPGFAMSSTIDVLEDIAGGNGPGHALVMLGYSGWGPQQLEAEIALNGWLTCKAAPDLVFGPKMEAKWEAALATLGVDPLLLSTQAGRA
ncbi:MAG: YqgE/AlgH family protein [Pseudomonadota bacterium]